MVQIFGKFQRFEYEGLSVTLNLSDFVFKAGIGDTYLEQIGYDRFPFADREPDMFYGYSGASHTEGEDGEPPFEFAWDLHLKPEPHRKLTSIVRQARFARKPVRLIDGLLVLDEVAPRTRAKVGAYEETIDGIVYFYPVFDIWPKISKLGRSNQLHTLKMVAKEWSPDRPVQGDVAA
jgi:hypothetical protein